MAGQLHQQQHHHHHQQQPPPPPLSHHEDISTVDTRAIRTSSGRRPASHFCPCCSCLMLTSERLPVRLEPCGHVACSRCAEPNTVIPCPTCQASAVRGRPDSILQAEVVNFVTYCYASNPATSVMTSDSNVHKAPPTNTNSAAHQLEDRKSRTHRQRDNSKVSHLRNRSDSGLWHKQLEMIGTRMHSLESKLEQLKTELTDLTKELANEVTRERQLKQLEVDTREKIDRLQEDLRRLGEQKAASVEVQTIVQSQIEAKKQVIQGVFAAQNSMSMELSKLQTVCSGGIGTQS